MRGFQQLEPRGLVFGRGARQPRDAGREVRRTGFRQRLKGPRQDAGAKHCLRNPEARIADGVEQPLALGDVLGQRVRVMATQAVGR
jgi:hypothetical protein